MLDLFTVLPTEFIVSLGQLVLSWLPADFLDAAGQILAALVALSLIAVAIVQFLKAQGVIGDGQAGVWNLRINLIIQVVMFAVSLNAGWQAQASDAETWARAVITLLTGAFMSSLVAKIIYIVGKFAGLFKSLTAGELVPGGWLKKLIDSITKRLAGSARIS